MPETTFHSLRIESIEHGKRLLSYGREIGANEMLLEEKLLKHAAPSLVAVIGERDSGKTRLISGLAQLSDGQFSETHTNADYCYYHHIDSPIYHEGLPANPDFIPSESNELKKLSFMEVRRDIDILNVIHDPSVLSSDGILFVIDSLDPWSGTLWKQVELYSASHAGKIIFCVTNSHLLHPKDFPVLQKHLQERISQVFAEGAPLKKIDYSDLFTFHEIRVYLENRAVGSRSWNELKTLKGEFEDAFEVLEVALVGQRKWLSNATDIANSLTEELFSLRHRIRYELLLRIETMGSHLKDQADEILWQVRSRLTAKAYLLSLFRQNTSLVSFREGLESILSEALYQEIGAHYNKTNELIADHARQFSSQHPSLSKFCPQLKGGSKQLQAPFLLEKQSVNNEINKVLRYLRLKPLFRQELEQIDQMTNTRLCLTMLLVIAAGTAGSFSFHLVGFILLALSIGCGVWCFWMRNKALDSFMDFLDDWFLGVGPRLLEPIDKLSTRLVNHAIDTYGNCFIPYLEIVRDRQKVMPERISKGRDLYVKNRELIKALSEE